MNIQMTVETARFLNTPICEVFANLSKAEQNKLAREFFDDRDGYWNNTMWRKFTMRDLMENNEEYYSFGYYVLPKLEGLQACTLKKIRISLESYTMLHIMVYNLTPMIRLAQVPLIIKHFSKDYLLDFTWQILGTNRSYSNYSEQNYSIARSLKNSALMRLTSNRSKSFRALNVLFVSGFSNEEIDTIAGGSIWDQLDLPGSYDHYDHESD